MLGVLVLREEANRSCDPDLAREARNHGKCALIRLESLLKPVSIVAALYMAYVLMRECLYHPQQNLCPIKLPTIDPYSSLEP